MFSFLLSRRSQAAERLIQGTKHLSQRDAQGLGQPTDVNQRRISLAPLDPTQVRPMNARPVGEFLLRQPAPFP